MNLRVFLDANVLFTAAYSPGGMAHLLFELQRHRCLRLLTASQALEEARINLEIKKRAALNELSELADTLEVFDSPSEIRAHLQLPEDDQRIFAAAVAGRATHLLTGDIKDFGPYFDKPGKTLGIRIQTVRRFFVDRFG